MKWTGLLCCLFSFSVIFSGQLEVAYKDNLNILIDDSAYTFASDKFKVKVPSYNVDKKIRQLSDDKLLALLNSNTHYIDIIKCSDDEYVAHLQGRLNGGTPFLGKVFYYATKGICYGAIAAGVIGTIVRNRRADRDTERLAQISNAIVRDFPNITPFQQMPRIQDLIPSSEGARAFVEGGLGNSLAQGGIDCTGPAGVIAGGTAAWIGQNKTADYIVQNSVWEFLAVAPNAARVGEHVLRRQAIISEAARAVVPRLGQAAGSGASQAAGQAAGNFARVAGSAAAGGAAKGAFRTFMGSAWGELCKKCGEVGAVIEVVAKGAEALGTALPFPI